MAAAFAGHAAVAMELARARADQITLAQAEDHDRIAGDLHDHVIQDLFALGMRMQGHAARTDPAAAEQVNGYVDTVDEIIRKIRTSIFGLHQPRAGPRRPARPGHGDHRRAHRAARLHRRHPLRRPARPRPGRGAGS